MLRGVGSRAKRTETVASLGPTAALFRRSRVAAQQKGFRSAPTTLRSGGGTATRWFLSRGASSTSMTNAQAKLLDTLKAFKGMIHVSGAQVTTARRLEAFGLVRLRDDGRLGPNGNADGERWTVELIEPTPRATNGSAEIVTPPLDPAAPRS